MGTVINIMTGMRPKSTYSWQYLHVPPIYVAIENLLLDHWRAQRHPDNTKKSLTTRPEACTTSGFPHMWDNKFPYYCSWFGSEHSIIWCYKHPNKYKIFKNIFHKKQTSLSLPSLYNKKKNVKLLPPKIESQDCYIIYLVGIHYTLTQYC